jgi:hypothetical protein
MQPLATHGRSLKCRCSTSEAPPLTAELHGSVGVSVQVSASSQLTTVAVVVIMARVLTVNDVLDGHAALDIECLDRIYLNAYVPILQTSSKVVAFLSGHLGFPFPSPALFGQMGDRFRRAVMSFSDANDIPWVRSGSGFTALPAGSPPARTRPGCRRSVTGSDRGRSTCSPSGGCTGCRCRSARRIMTPGTGGRPRCGRWRSPAPSSSMPRGMPAASSRR